MSRDIKDTEQDLAAIDTSQTLAETPVGTTFVGAKKFIYSKLDELEQEVCRLQDRDMLTAEELGAIKARLDRLDAIVLRELKADASGAPGSSKMTERAKLWAGIVLAIIAAASSVAVAAIQSCGGG
jgi:hypothetical protein